MLEDDLFDLTNNPTHPERPFTGQPHTDQGERGKAEVCGLRFRDLADCAVRALADISLADVMREDMGRADKIAQSIEDGTLNYNDLYDIVPEDIDPIALVQCITCRVEQFMGIFPNIPGRDPEPRPFALTRERPTMLKKTKTARGFSLIEFTDKYGESCSIQKSSAASFDAVWLGIDKAKPQIMCSKAAAHGLDPKDGTGWRDFPIPDDVHISTCMHLTREQVAELIPVLQKFVDTGEL